MNKILLNFCCFFIVKKKNRHHFREKYKTSLLRILFLNEIEQSITKNFYNIAENIKKENILLSKQLKVVEKLLLEENIKEQNKVTKIGNGNFYGEDEWVQKYWQGTGDFLNNDLVVENIKDGLVFNCGIYEEYAVYDEKLNPISISDIEATASYVRHNIDFKNNKIFKKIKFKEVEEEVVFLGICTISSYGHILVGTINRLWVLQDENIKNKKFVLIVPPNTEKQLEFFKLAGLKEENIIQVKIGEGYKFKNIIIPTPTAYHVKNGKKNCHKRFMENVMEINKNIVSNSSFEKIYLSRIKEDGSRVSGKKIFGERKIINIFRKNGFAIICPDEYSYREQLEMYRGCKVLASVSGSALHNSIFLKDDAEVICIVRGYGISFQAPFDYLMNIKTNYIFDSIICSNVNGRIGDGNVFCFINKNFQQYLDDNHMIYASDDLMFDEDEYSRIYE